MHLGQLLVYLNKPDEAINVVSNYLSVLSDSDTPNIAKMVDSIYNLGTYMCIYNMLSISNIHIVQYTTHMRYMSLTVYIHIHPSISYIYRYTML